jgi:hypothetical protein
METARDDFFPYATITSRETHDQFSEFIFTRMDTSADIVSAKPQLSCRFITLRALRSASIKISTLRTQLQNVAKFQLRAARDKFRQLTDLACGRLRQKSRKTSSKHPRRVFIQTIRLARCHLRQRRDCATCALRCGQK